MQISTNIDYISIMPAAVNTSLGYTAIYGAHVVNQAASSCLPEGADVFVKLVASVCSRRGGQALHTQPWGCTVSAGCPNLNSNILLM